MHLNCIIRINCSGGRYSRPVKTEQGENTDSPVALTPAKINANNITAAIEQVAKDDENLATLRV